MSKLLRVLRTVAGILFGGFFGFASLNLIKLTGVRTQETLDLCIVLVFAFGGANVGAFGWRQTAIVMTETNDLIDGEKPEQLSEDAGK